MSIFIANKFSKKIVVAPASKSYAQRLLLSAALGNQNVSIANTGHCDDVLNIVKVIEQLGTEVSKNDNGYILFPRQSACTRTLNCGESGLGIRLTTSIASTFGGQFAIDGEGSLKQRPLKQFHDFLPQMGVEVSSDNGFLPIKLNGELQGGSYTVDGSMSSQYISGLLMALPLCEQDSVLTVLSSKSTPYIDVTLDVLKDFGIQIENNNYKEYTIKGNQKYIPNSAILSVEGDWSGAAFWIVFGLINGDINIENLNFASAQADKELLSVVEQIGAEYLWKENVLCIQKKSHHPFSFDATDCPDLFPILVVLAASIQGTSRIKGVHRLKHKESDRATVLKSEFSSLGLNIEIIEDEMVIHGIGKLNSGKLDSHNDHRIAMAGAIAATLTPEGITIEGEECVNKSYPEFWNDLKSN